MAGLGSIGLSMGQDWQNIGSDDTIGQSAQRYLADQAGLIDSSDPTQLKNIQKNGVLGAVKSNFLQNQMGFAPPNQAPVLQGIVTPVQTPSLGSNPANAMSTGDGGLLDAVGSFLFGG